MRVFGLGLKGATKFCGLMDIPAFKMQNTYDIIISNIYSCVQTAIKTLPTFPLLTSEHQGEENSTELTVSGAGTWKSEDILLFTKKVGKKRIKTLGGKGNLTGKMIDKWTVYYGSAIRRKCDSVEDMRNAIWDTFYYFFPQTKIANTRSARSDRSYGAVDIGQQLRMELSEFKHDYQSILEDVSKAVYPIQKSIHSAQKLLKWLHTSLPVYST